MKLFGWKHMVTPWSHGALSLQKYLVECPGSDANVVVQFGIGNWGVPRGCSQQTLLSVDGLL